ncbi:hypothetical protein SAMN04487895_102115 [Paenibacillus sophorae]|uniref:Uncharacterized protein n=1 Tax=Paenibacillus sophorae TaxID=1333845 RepID=A0A1H8IAY3_9BACL|nr:DUF5693 family protein [Paenibacillus sophorae]QWU15889.1 hypothetical protein KP014_00975 [Paenibacillus sophorae]SEN64998.1 hypothetical protein SAMN04487895_102115 [Paenibacillus sophorae]
MQHKWQRWNLNSRKWLWIIVVIGLIAALPVVYDRLQTEKSSKTVEIVFDYRDLVDAASYRANPQDYISQQLDRLKEAGVQSMAVYESTLEDYRKARRVMFWGAQDIANLTDSVIPENENYTYVLFTSKANGDALKPTIQSTFGSLGIATEDWNFRGQQGLIIKTPLEDALLKPMAPDEAALANLYNKGFQIVPRLVDSLPYNEEAMKQLIERFESLHVKRILFEGDSVKGFNDNEDKKSLDSFAELLKQHGIGIATIENLKQQQKGFNKLAYMLDYNVVRLYSLSENDSTLKPDVIADRFALATKDRNIRMLYLNTAPTRNTDKAQIDDSLENLITSLSEPGGAVEKIKNNGFTLGQATAFDVADSPFQRYFKLVAVIGAVALVALTISYFIPWLTLLAWALGLVGSAGLLLVKPTLFEQALALAVAISAPTVAMVLAVRKINKSGPQLTTNGKGKAAAPGNLSGSASATMNPQRRLLQSLVLYVRTAVISLCAVPFVIALLNNITYSLVLNQFRGVSLLHIAPIGLVAVYVLLYRGEFALNKTGKLLRTPVTLAMVIAAAVLGIIGLYYLSRTGNSGTASSYELAFRNFMESAFGVRPRSKEFLLAHPLFILGAFLALKYRNAAYLMIVAVIGQLSMVDTFAHIHSPVLISLVRGLLGLGLGLILGVIAVIVWQIAEGCWKRWSPLLKK